MLLLGVQQRHEAQAEKRRTYAQSEIPDDVYFPLGTKSVDIAHGLLLESLHINLDYFVLNKLPISSVRALK